MGVSIRVIDCIFGAINYPTQSNRSFFVGKVSTTMRTASCRGFVGNK